MSDHPNSSSLVTFLEDCLGRLQNLDTKQQEYIEEIRRASDLNSLLEADRNSNAAMPRCISLGRMNVAA